MSKPAYTLEAIIEWIRCNSLESAEGSGRVVQVTPLLQRLNGLLAELDELDPDEQDRDRSRKPDYILGSLLKGTKRRNNNLGAAWKQGDGSITLQLAPCVVLSGNAPDVSLRLFANRDRKDDSSDYGEDAF
jgi:hypothetical protein